MKRKGKETVAVPRLSSFNLIGKDLETTCKRQGKERDDYYDCDENGDDDNVVMLMIFMMTLINKLY